MIVDGVINDRVFFTTPREEIKMPHARMKPAERKEEIHLAAVEVCRTVGLAGLTREAIAKKAGVTEGLVSHYFNTMKQLRRSVARRAMRDRDGAILSQMLTDNNFSKMLNAEHRQVALDFLKG